jgi:hypothetical protein
MEYREVHYTEYTFLKIKFVYLDELYVTQHLIKTKPGSFESYNGDPYDKHYSSKINSYYKRNLDYCVPKLVYSDFSYTHPKYYDKYNNIIRDILSEYNDIIIVTISKEKSRKVKDPRLICVDPEP